MSLIVLPVNKTKQKIYHTINIIKCCSEPWEKAQFQLYHREEKKSIFLLGKILHWKNHLHNEHIQNQRHRNVTGRQNVRDDTRFFITVSREPGFHRGCDEIGFLVIRRFQGFFRLKVFQGL